MALGRIYSVGGENITVTATTRGLIGLATSATELNAGGRIRIRRVEIGQRANATSAQCGVLFSKRDQAATLTHATGRTPTTLDVGGPISAIVSGTAGHTPLNCGTGSSTDSGGTYSDLWAANFNALNGYLWIPTPGEEIIVHNTSVFCVRFAADPATLTGWTIWVMYEEF